MSVPSSSSPISSFSRIFHSALGMATLLMAYSLLGSAAFFYLETGLVTVPVTSRPQHHLAENLREELKKIKDLKVVTEKINVAKIYKLINEIKDKLDDVDKDESTSNKDLDFWKCLYYCFTIYTSIGYGNIVPTNALSRLFTCIYALLGIPLCLVTLDRTGKAQTRLLNWFYRGLWRIAKRHVTECSVCFMLGLISAYLAGGYYVYSAHENWSVDETIYFLLISFTTVGFGDFCPSDSRHFVVTGLYQFLGLSLVATLFNMLTAKFESTPELHPHHLLHDRRTLKKID